VAFIGNYLPRVCGIATFTFDLCAAVRRVDPGGNVTVVAMNDTPSGYHYPERVEFQVREHHLADYPLAADFLNNHPDIDMISLQHEFGIFGGTRGSHVVSLMRHLKKPVVVTCHSVPEEPDDAQREVLREIASLARRLVVMSRHAADTIVTLYGADARKVALIPHGIHPFPFVDPSTYKGKLRLGQHPTLLTFGLLSRNKGIESMIDALPLIVRHYPDVLYVILGATHPVVVRDEGEVYRESLVRRAADLDVSKNVLFLDEFVELHRLLEFIGAADVCVTPYLNMDQATSGVLAYAMAMGKAVVSTPYRYAREMLSDGRGRLVPVEDPTALSREVLSLLGDERTMTSVRKKAYAFSRAMSWPVVARSYTRLFEEVRGEHMEFAHPMVVRLVDPRSVTAQKNAPVAPPPSERLH
jgi:glycosyltransferase involved in cell wall biosynthesis